MNKILSAGPVRIGGDQPLVLIAGPCVIENEEHTLALARALQELPGESGLA